MPYTLRWFYIIQWNSENTDKKDEWNQLINETLIEKEEKNKYVGILDYIICFPIEIPDSIYLAHAYIVNTMSYVMVG